jgi:hypothetical protein
MPGAGWKHGPPQEEVIRAGGGFVDEELNLHVHPALISLEPRDERDVFEPCPEWLHQDRPLSM